MTLDKWTTGDTITALNINKRSVRRGTTSDRNALTASDITVGDHFFNEDEECAQVLVDTSPVIWMNVGRILLGADSNEVAVTGNTATQVKDIDVIKHTSTWAGFLIVIVVRMKTSASKTASLRCRLNGAGSDSLVLTSTSATYEIKKGIIDASGLAAGRHTIELFLDGSDGSAVATMDMTEVWGS